MKNLETLFESENFDFKNITNKSEKTISRETLEAIEAGGVTIETLENLGVPIFKYKTQITIHGLFPALQNNYIGGYKNLFQNKNLSIGVKWQAVDYNKKTAIYNTIRKYLKGWHIVHNSSEYFIYKQTEIIKSKEHYLQLLEVCKSDAARINKSLFYGNSGVFLSGNFFGQFLVTYINLGAVKTENVNAVIENICGADLQTVNAKIEADRLQAEKERTEREAESKRQAEILAAKQAPLIKAAKELLTARGYVLVEKAEIKQEAVYVQILTNTEAGTFKFRARKFEKKWNEKKWRYTTCESENLDFQNYNSHRSQTINNTTGGWFLQAPAPVQIETTNQPANSPKTPPIEATANPHIFMVDYSEKAIAVFGDTKPIKEKLKQAGGKFNAFLTYNGQKSAGWIFSKTQTEAVKSILN